MNVQVTVTVKSDACLICGKKNKGIHFNVASCRACAAFYRRALQSHKIYKCAKGTKNCDLKTKPTSGTPLCRFCRLQKCQQLGMTLTENDPISPSTSDATTRVTSQNMELSKNPSNYTSSSDVPINKSPNLEWYLALRPLEEKIKQILSQSYPTPITPGIRLTFMQQLEYGFNQFYEEVRPKNPLIYSTETEHEVHTKWEANYMIMVAKMLMYCKQFAELELLDKILLYKHFKMILRELERFYTAVSLADEPTYLMFDNIAVKATGEVKACVYKEWDKEQFLKTLPFWQSLQDKMLKTLIYPLKRLKITKYELVYMCAHTLWNVQEIAEISENAQKVAEEVMDQVLQDLHNYYVYDLRLTNYAPRLVNMLKLIDASKTISSAYKEVILMSQVQNIFDFKVDIKEIVNG